MKTQPAHIKKTKRQHQQQTTVELLEDYIRRIPGEEDFWVIAVIHDDPDAPTWDERLTTRGKYDQAIRTAAMIINGLMRQPKPPRIKIEAFQGEGARAMLDRIGEHEARYRQECKAQPNN